MIRNLDTLPVDKIDPGITTGAKKTVTVTVEVDGQIYQESYDATLGFMLFIDQPDVEGMPTTMNRSLASEKLIHKVMLAAQEMYANVNPVYATLSKAIRSALGR